MPRSKNDRSFGFRAPGLVRILTAADPAEVLTAMEALGIQLPEKTGFVQQMLLAARALFKPLDLFLSGLEVSARNFRHVITAAEADLAPGRGGTGAFVVEGEDEKKRLKAFLLEIDNGRKSVMLKRRSTERELETTAKQTEEEVALTFLS